MAVRIGHGWRLVIDGHDISHHVCAFSFNANVGSVTTIELTLMGEITVDRDGTVRIGDGPVVLPEKSKVKRGMDLK